MIEKFYIIDGDHSDDAPSFINQPLADILASVDAKAYWLHVKPVGQPGMSISSRQDFIGYMKTLKDSKQKLEVVCYYHKAGSRLAELDELLS